MLLWNPSTRESRMLPSTSGIKTFHLEWRYGFGYDCKGDDYKVLALVPQISNKDDNFSYKSIMYTLRTNSWRSIKDDTPLYTHFEDKASVFVSGAIHWKAWVQRPCIATKTSRSEVIVSFDLTSETYTEVPLPQDVGVSSALNQVGASKGCLCLLSCDINDESNEIWVMKEYGVTVSWTKTVKIPSLNCIRLTPMTWLVENGEILLNVDKPASYNPKKDSVRYFATNEEVRVLKYPECIGYEESLVSPNACCSNLVSNETCGLNIKTGRTRRKEEKDIDDTEKMKKSTNEKKGEESTWF
uniref:F-box/kelch-repeat protein At3g23880-like n=1 Tax=Fragaria vesca subsp. vesca TaxID=101020 RepID=UPI0005C84A10|nr:PREDICTED: F-box/kelch-repeat protein At3g23880-like [Fragaria vesca subsp. vesca]